MSGEDIRWIASILLTFAAGYFLHVLKARRDDRAAKEARKEAAESARKGRIREFKGFMSQFRSWAERSSPSCRYTEFRGQVNTFRGETGRLEDDLPEQKRATFNQAVMSLCSLTDSQVSEHEIFTDLNGHQSIKTDIGRDRVASAIDDVLKALE